MEKLREFERHYGWRINPENIDKALESLDAREQTVIRRYYGVPPFKSESMASIGRNFGDSVQISAERVRQIRIKALKKLRHPDLREALRKNIHGKHIDWTSNSLSRCVFVIRNHPYCKKHLQNDNYYREILYNKSDICDALIFLNLVNGMKEKDILKKFPGSFRTHVRLAVKRIYSLLDQAFWERYPDGYYENGRLLAL